MSVTYINEVWRFIWWNPSYLEHTTSGPWKKRTKKVYLILYPVPRVHDTKFTKYLENPVKLGLIGRENECKLRYPSLVQRETKIVINIS